MIVSRKMLKQKDITSETSEMLQNWGFSVTEAEILIKSMMLEDTLFIYKNDVNDYVEFSYYDNTEDDAFAGHII